MSRAAQQVPDGATPVAPRRPIPRPAMWVIGLTAGLGLVFGVYQLGRPAMPPRSAAQSAVTAPAINEARVSELLAAVRDNPQDTTSLLSLGNIYLNGGDSATADGFFRQVLAYDQVNEVALVGAGVAAFNQGRLDEARSYLTRATELYPDNPQAHYGLGFVHLTANRRDLMEVEWAKVVALAPGSDMAGLVQRHLGAGTLPSPTPTPPGR